MKNMSPKSIPPEILLAEFPQPADLVYLNHAAVSPWPARSAEAVKQFVDENVSMGATHYKKWLNTERTLRQQIKDLVNAPSVDDIALLKNTSEALSVVACGIDWQAGDNVVSSNEEFPSNRVPWQAQQANGVDFRPVDISNNEPEQALIEACDGQTRVLTISSVQYSSGIRLDLAVLGEFCRKNNILFCVDAIQSIGAHKIDVQEIHADFVMADAHKWMLGPEGIALFYCKAERREQLALHQFGWHMLENAGDFDATSMQPTSTAQRFECGSLNMLGIHALSASLSLIEEIGIEQIERIIFNNISYLIDKLNNIDGISILTPVQQRHHAGIVTFSLDSIDSVELHRMLMNNNVICAQRGAGIRFSPHFYISTEKLDKAIEQVERLSHQLK